MHSGGRVLTGKVFTVTQRDFSRALFCDVSYCPAWLQLEMYLLVCSSELIFTDEAVNQIVGDEFQGIITALLSRLCSA